MLVTKLVPMHTSRSSKLLFSVSATTVAKQATTEVTTGITTAKMTTDATTESTTVAKQGESEGRTEVIASKISQIAVVCFNSHNISSW